MSGQSAIVTVVGTDQVGIIARVSGFLAERGVNIEDISQTILSGNFVMMMMVRVMDGGASGGSAKSRSLEDLKAELAALGETMHVSISMMHERVFSAMHRI